MDASSQSPNQDNVDVKPAFRKPRTDAASRKYRRHSPLSRSPSDGSPKHDCSASPKLTGEDSRTVHESQSRSKEDVREVDRDSYRSHHGRGSDTYRHSDRQFSKSSHRYYRHDDYSKHEKRADYEERNHHRFSRSGWESRGGSHFDERKSRDHWRDGDKYSRDKYDISGYKTKDRERQTSFTEDHKYKDRDLSFDKAKSGKRHPQPQDVDERERRAMEKDDQDDKRDFQRIFGDYRGERLLQQEEFKDHLIDSSSRNRDKESYKNEAKEIGGQYLTKEGKKEYDDLETNGSKDQFIREPAEQSEEKSVLWSENQESLSKRQKFSLNKYTDGGKRVSKFSTVADAKESIPKQPADHKMTAGEDQVNASSFANDLNAAKVAAMKAAETVNKNLIGGVGTGFMTADQKKKLLWGNKKATTPVESGHRWDTALFSDQERQEKFNKLMSLRLPWCLWPIVGCEGRTKNGSQTRKPRWQQPPSREAEGTSAGFREAVHCWSAEERWPYCWTGSLSISSKKCRSLFLNFLIWSVIILFTYTRIMLIMSPDFCLVKLNLLFGFSAFAENWILHDIPTAEFRVKFALAFCDAF